MTNPTKQLAVYQYIQSGHTPKEASKHFGVSLPYVSRSCKIESARHGVEWRDKRKWVKSDDACLIILKGGL